MSIFRGTLALPSPVALQLGFMWGARIPGWDGLGTILEPKMEIEGYKTEIYEVEKTFCDKVFQDCDLMGTDCVQEVMKRCCSRRT